MADLPMAVACLGIICLALGLLAMCADRLEDKRPWVSSRDFPHNWRQHK